jgi:phosphotransferase system HPr (HPr) family protein
MIEIKTEIVNKLGLHARAAAKLSHLANSFSSEIEIVYNNTRVNAKSLLGILTLAASVGNNISIIAEGNDEDAAVKAIKELIDRKFDEEK